MSARERLLERWGTATAVEDVISGYCRALNGHWKAIRRQLLDADRRLRDAPPEMAEGVAWSEGGRVLWMHCLNVAGPHFAAPPDGPASQGHELPAAFLADLGDEACFWLPNAAFAYPLEMVFHHGRRAAFERVCRNVGRVDPYTLRRPRAAGP